MSLGLSESLVFSTLKHVVSPHDLTFKAALAVKVSLTYILFPHVDLNMGSHYPLTGQICFKMSLKCARIIAAVSVHIIPPPSSSSIIFNTSDAL